MNQQKRAGDRYLELHAQGLTNTEIARACGVSQAAVSAFFKKNGVARNKQRRTSKHNKPLRAAERAGMTYKQAAEHLGLSVDYVSRLCKRLGIKLVDGRTTGTVKGYTVDDYRKRAAAGMTKAQAAADMGVAGGSVSYMSSRYGIEFADEKQERIDRYVSLHAKGLSNIEIAREMGVCPSAVTQIFKRLGIRRNNWGNYEKHRKAVEQYAADGLTYTEAAERMGLTSKHVRTVCRVLGVALAEKK